MTRSWMLRPAVEADAGWLADLRADALRADLERFGRFDRGRVRQRFLDHFVPADTEVIVVDGVPAGCVAVRPEADAQWIEHFYLVAETRGRGIGGEVLREVMAAHRDHRPYRLIVVRGSAAQRLYERAGFGYRSDHENGVDLFFEESHERRGGAEEG